MSETESDSGSTGVSNASAANNAVNKMRQQAAERKRKERVETVENLGTKQWLESKLEEQARPHAVMGRSFQFKPIGNGTVEEILELAAEEAQGADGVDANDLDDVDPDDMESMPKLLRTMRETLGEHCLDDHMDASAFARLPVDTLQETFEDVAMGGELTDKEVERTEKFR